MLLLKALGEIADFEIFAAVFQIDSEPPYSWVPLLSGSKELNQFEFWFVFIKPYPNL